MSIATYAVRHVQAFLASLGRLARNPFGTILTVLVIALALALPLGLRLLVTNTQMATGGFFRLQAAVVATTTRTRAMRRMRRADMRTVSLEAGRGARAEACGRESIGTFSATSWAARCCPTW